MSSNTKATQTVVNGASVTIIIAWQSSIKLSHAHASEEASVRNGYIVPVSSGALVEVLAYSKEA
jgi:hypothetical protein